MRKPWRPSCSQAMSVEPEPPKRSSTFSPVLEEYCSARAANSTGFSVRWTIFCGVTFFTTQRSGTLAGP